MTLWLEKLISYFILATTSLYSNEVSLATLVNINQNYPTKINPLGDVRNITNNFDYHEIKNIQRSPILENLWPFKESFEQQSLRRRKRYFWNSDKDENAKTSTSVSSLHSMTNLIDEESTTTARSWRSWFSGAVDKAKNTYKNIKMGLKKGIKKVGRRIAKGFLKMRKYFTRSEDKFNIFANKVKERVEGGDENAIILLHKLGIDVNYDKDGNVIGSEVNKTSLPVRDILIKEGIFYENNITFPEDGEMENGLVTFEETTKTTLPSPTFTNQLTKQTSLKETSHDLNTSTFTSFETLNTTYTSLAFKTIMKEEFTSFPKIEPSSPKTVYSYVSEPSESFTTDRKTFSSTLQSKFDLSETTSAFKDLSSKSLDIILTNQFTTVAVTPTPVKLKTSTVSLLTSNDSYSSSDIFSSEISRELKNETTTKLFMISETTKIQDESKSTYSSITEITPSPITNISTSSVNLSFVNISSTFPTMKNTGIMNTDPSTSLETTKMSTLSSTLMNSIFEMSPTIQHSVLRTSADNASFHSTKKFEILAVITNAINTTMEENSALSKSSAIYSTEHSHLDAKTNNGSSIETVTKPYNAVTKLESSSMSKSSFAFSSDLKAEIEGKSSIETGTEPYTKTTKNESSVLFESIGVFSRKPSYLTSEEDDKSSIKPVTKPYIKPTDKKMSSITASSENLSHLTAKTDVKTSVETVTHPYTKTTKEVITSPNTRHSSSVSRNNFEPLTDFSSSTEFTEHTKELTETSTPKPTVSTSSTEPPPFPDIFKDSGVRERLHEVFMKGDFSHDDLRTTFEFDPALYEEYYDYDYK